MNFEIGILIICMYINVDGFCMLLIKGKCFCMYIKVYCVLMYFKVIVSSIFDNFLMYYLIVCILIF